MWRENRYTNCRDLVEIICAYARSGGARGDLEVYWLKMKTVVDGMRNPGWPTWSEHTEYLYNEVMKIRRQQHPELYK